MDRENNNIHAEEAELKGSCLAKRMYLATKELKKRLKLTTVLNRAKRKFSSGFDSVADQITDAETAIQEEYEDIEDLDLNIILRNRAIIQKGKELQEAIKTEYKYAFGKEMPNTTPEDDED